MSKIEYVSPLDIEKRSFEIIDKELGERGIILDPMQAPIIKRAIHTTADFEYVDSLVFSDNAIEKVRELIRGGADIVTDTEMAKSGINKSALGKYGGNVICYMNDPDVQYASHDSGLTITRATLSMRKASHLKNKLIFAIGNAPTALITLHEMMEEGSFTPEFVIGVPVGFVNVEASKELFINSDVPHIINRGRKGGSPVAAAIVNAILYGMDK